MRKRSIKTLSLALSLLLAVTLLCSLSIPVWAETEAVLGDLNGDALVNGDDITVLEAVLSSAQDMTAGVNYDISGNKMVGSEDLTVLKNLVDPDNNPALEDLLADGQTDDLLEIVSSVSGGQLQRAVVHGGGTPTPDCPRGSSTRALEMDATGTMTVVFDAAQDWSSKAALEMDTLWVSGDRNVTVVLLGKDGKTQLGVPCEAAADENGWSRISVDLTGLASSVRKSVGGFMLTASADAHLFVDNLSLTEAQSVSTGLTRAELEEALIEVAWDWYLKGSAYEYDSTCLTSDAQHLNHPLSGYSGGKTRLDLFPSLENATSHTSVFTVCSGFAYDMYLEALGYPILGAKLNCLTMTIWRNTSYYPADGVGSYDMSILRWHSLGENVIYNTEDTKTSTYITEADGTIRYSNWYSAAEVKAFFADYQNNLRPGDIIVMDSPGHTIVYVGNGMCMDFNGSKYDMTTGVDTREDKGTHFHYKSVEELFLNNPDSLFYLDKVLNYPKTDATTGETKQNHLVIIRPLDLLLEADTDNNPDNDKLNPDYVLQTGVLDTKLSFDTTNEVKTSGYGITETTETRMQYPAMNIDRTVNITPYGTAVKGDTITYTVAITNNSNNEKYAAYYGDADGVTYENLWVVEHIPANTQLVDAPNATVVGDAIRWNVSVPAGQTLNLSYTVQVTGEIGDTIVSTGGWVNNIPSNTITNTIGGEKLSNVDQAALYSLYAAGTSSWNIDTAEVTGTAFAEEIYKNTIGIDLQLPDVQEIMEIFFSDYKYTKSGGYYLHNSDVTRYMYALNSKAPELEDQVYYDMLVRGYYGGIWCYTDEFNGERRINELREEYLEPGDILIYMGLTPSTDYGATKQTRVVEGYTILVYLGNSRYASIDSLGNLVASADAVSQTSAFKHDLFVCLRPSQVYENLSEEGIPTYTVTWENHDGSVLETDEGVPHRNVPAFNGTEPTKDGYTFAGWTPTVRPATGDITYTALFTRALTDSKLTDKELSALAAITAQDVKDAFAYGALTSGNLHAAAPWIYKQGGVAVPDDLSTNKIYATACKFFTWNSTAKEWTVNASISAPYKTMLVTNAYGGTALNNPQGFDLGYLQIGDIFCAAFDKAVTGASSTYYYTFLYQGDGRFLLISADSAVYQLEELLNKKYKDTDLGWSYFFVIRPEEYNTPGNRDVALRSLTSAEKYRLSKLTGSDIKYSSRNIYGTYSDYYNAVGITATMPQWTNSNGELKNMSQENVRDRLFVSATGGRVIFAAEDDIQRYFQKIAVPCYGGSQLANEITVTDTIAGNILQVGDVLAGIHKNAYTNADGDATTENVPFSAMYQGNDTFLVYYYAYDAAQGKDAMTKVTWTTAQVDALNFLYYYTLRPEMLAAETKDTYTVTWANDDGTVLETDESAAFTLPSYEGETPVKAPDAQYSYTFAGWDSLFTSVNRDVTYTAVYDKTVNSYTVTWLNEDGSTLATDTVPYGEVPVYSGETPTKESVNGYHYAFAAWDTEVVAVTGDVTYTATYAYAGRDLTAHKLTEEELAAIASITSADAKANLKYTNLSNVAPWIYQQAKIDYSSTNGGLATVYSTLTKFFAKTNYEDGSAGTWAVRSSISAPYTTMLVPGSYGGTQVTNAPAFDIRYLQVGDFLCAAYDAEVTGADSTAYHVYLYQGNGNFLYLRDDFGVYTAEQVLSKTYTVGEQDYNWSYYYAIRPENANSATRDISLRALTDAEKYALSQLDNSVVSMGSVHLRVTLPRYYEKVGIVVDMTGDYYLTHEGTRDQLFTWSNSLLTPRAANNDVMRYFQKMMVNVYGGNKLAETVTLTDAIANGMLQIGDIVAGIFEDADANNTGSSFTAMYQGNNQFLVQYKKWDAASAAQTYQTVSLTTADIDALRFTYYYTLRPENLATISDDATFTVTWKNEDGTTLETDENVALLTMPSYDGATPAKASTAQYSYTFAGWTPLMTPVNGDVTYIATYTATVNSYTVIWKDASGTTLETDEDVLYGTTPTYDGRRPYNKNENKGFAGWDKEISAVTGDVTYTATYKNLRDMTAGGLTEEEMDVIANLTLSDYANAGSRSFEKVFVWAYKEAGIDITSAYGYQNRSSLNVHKVFTGDTAIARDYYNMLYVAGSDGINVTGVGTNNLQIGDIVAMAYLWSDAENTTTDGNYMYYVALYQGKDDQGNDKFLVAYDSGWNSSNKRIGASAIMTFEEIENSMQDADTTWAYRFVLRPSQLAIPRTVTYTDAKGTVVATEEVTYGTTYETAPVKTVNGYTYTFGDAEGAVITTDTTFTATSYTRVLSASMLTNEEMAVLAAISPEDVKAAFSSKELTSSYVDKSIPWIYKNAGIECTSEFDNGQRTYQIRSKLFSSSKVTDENGNTVTMWTVKPTVRRNLSNPSFDFTYGPMLVLNSYGGVNVKNAPAFDIDALQIGDFFCGMFTYRKAGATSDSNVYYTYMYQGKDNEGNSKFLLIDKNSAVCTLEDILAKTYTAEGNEYHWSTYYVIRPERYNDAKRDIADKPLTSAESHRLANLTADYVSRLDAGALSGFVNRIYSEAGINLDLKGKKANEIFDLLFSSIPGTNYYTAAGASTNATTKYFQDMLVDGYYGGNVFANYGTPLSEDTLEIGDVFAGQAKYPSKNDYWGGVYQGNGNFLMYNWYEEGTGYEVVNIETINSYNFNYYYILRPDNLAD